MNESNKKVKVLYFVDRMLRGGIQTFVLDNMKHMDGSKVQIDYLLLDDGIDYELEDTIRKLGSKVFKLKGIWLRKPFDYIKYCKKLNEFFMTHDDYKVVHLHSSSKNFLVLYYAKKYGIKTRIAHSHCIGFQSVSKLQTILGTVMKIPLRKVATHYFACSENAGKWMFGKKNIEKGKVTTVNNAVDIDKFAFNPHMRIRMRGELKVDGDIVFGHVGRFTDQKNHSFLIDIFFEIHNQNQNTKLILIGTGVKEDEIMDKVASLGLSDSIIFAGFHTNVSDYMQAMDVFLFPSKFEGLGLVLIEAQASGLPCFASADVVPMEAKISELVTYISLNSEASEWAKCILNSELKRRNVNEAIMKAGYSIESTAEFLEEFYINKLQ